MHPLARQAFPGFGVDDETLDEIKRQIATGYIRFWRKRGIEPPRVDGMNVRGYTIRRRRPEQQPSEDNE